MSNSKKLFSILIFTALFLTACGTPGNSNEVKVTLTDFGIEASRSDFEAGATYTFVITNEGAIPHEFVIAEPLNEDEHMEDMSMEGDEGEMHHEGLIVEVEEDELPAGKTVRIDVTFPDSPPDEPVEFACHIEGHYEAGMHSPITIK